MPLLRPLGCLLVVALIAPAGGPSIAKTGALFDHDAIVRIVAVKPSGKAYGSGFLRSPSGEIVTAWHVLSGATRFSVEDRHGRTLPRARIVRVGYAQDLAVLRVDRRANADYAFITAPESGLGTKWDLMAESGRAAGLLGGGKARVTAPAATFPYSEAVPATDFPAMKHPFRKPTRLVVFDSVIQKGMSGGPLLLMQGQRVVRAIGVIGGGDASVGRGRGWAVELSELSKARPVNGETNPSRLTGDGLLVNLSHLYSDLAASSFDDAAMGLTNGRRAGGDGLRVDVALGAPASGLLCSGERYSLEVRVSRRAFLRLYSVDDDGGVNLAYAPRLPVERTWRADQATVAVRTGGPNMRLVAVAVPAPENAAGAAGAADKAFGSSAPSPRGCYGKGLGLRADLFPGSAALHAVSYAIYLPGSAVCPTNDERDRRHRQFVRKVENWKKHPCPP